MDRYGYERLIAGKHAASKTNVDRVVEEVVRQFDLGYDNAHDDEHNVLHLIDQMYTLFLHAGGALQREPEDQIGVIIQDDFKKIAAIAIRGMDLVDRVEERSLSEYHPPIQDIVT